jgi:hypothetical protein
MDSAYLEQLLNAVANGEESIPEALERLRSFPLDSSLEFARLDTHRTIRTGRPEVVFCQGKTTAQCVAIAQRLSESNPLVLMTRANVEVGEAVCTHLPGAIYHERARCITVGNLPDTDSPTGYVAVLTAGTADLPVAEEAILTLRCLGTPVQTAFDVGVAGLHRLLAVRPLLDSAVCIVVVAGMEGALASVVGGLVQCPVVACPTSVGYGTAFGGVSALLTMLNSCASGVAVVNIDNGFGAGQFAHLIVQVGISAVQESL